MASAVQRAALARASWSVDRERRDARLPPGFGGALVAPHRWVGSAGDVRALAAARADSGSVAGPRRATRSALDGATVMKLMDVVLTTASANEAEEVAASVASLLETSSSEGDA